MLKFSTLDSTNAEALRSGAPPGHVYIAETQTKGRGRHGRVWHSRPGNLHMTLCAVVPGNRAPGQLAFVAGLSAFDAISELAPSLSFSLKWPNDILINGKKIAGILIEAAEDDKYVVGIGINLRFSPRSVEMRYPTTDLMAESGIECTTDQCAEEVCVHFERWFGRWLAEGFQPLRAVWLASGNDVGEIIRVSNNKTLIEGIFEGLNDDGALLLKDAEGVCQVITTGDVMFPMKD
ncbi:MAG: biotin--[acetyl-CoA-carboxylase] ligase [Pseudomonadota bacterium]|nr:biotin--[acetyl-CoA-carboxylase] ligase [Pseudomonadota bacterium]